MNHFEPPIHPKATIQAPANLTQLNPLLNSPNMSADDFLEKIASKIALSIQDTLDTYSPDEEGTTNTSSTVNGISAQITLIIDNGGFWEFSGKVDFDAALHSVVDNPQSDSGSEDVQGDASGDVEFTIEIDFPSWDILNFSLDTQDPSFVLDWRF